MLEKQLSALLAAHLNLFIRNLNEEQLRISLWRGDLVLRELHLQPDILDHLALLLFPDETGASNSPSQDDITVRSGDGVASSSASGGKALLLPFTVVSGVIRELTISVPWAALHREPISVEVRGIDLVLGPLRSRTYNSDEEKARQEAIKCRCLAEYERAREMCQGLMDDPSVAPSPSPSPHASHVSDTERSSDPSPSPPSYMERLIQTVTRNVHVILRDVSISYLFDYEDLNPRLASALTLTIDVAYVTTTDEAFDDRFIVDLSVPLCKCVSVEGLQVKIHASREAGNPLHPSESKYRSQAAVSCSDAISILTEGVSLPKWKYTQVLLEAPALTIQFKAASSASAGGGATNHGGQVPSGQGAEVAVLFTEHVHTQISFGALQVLMSLFHSLREHLRGARYRQFLYLLSGESEYVVSKDAPTLARRRWRFAIACVLADVAAGKQGGGYRERHGSRIEGAVAFAKVRRAYCALWKRFQGVPWLPALRPEEHKELLRLEREQSLEQLLFLRCLAYAELSCEKGMTDIQQSWIAVARRRCAQRAEGSSAGEHTDGGAGGVWKWLRWQRRRGLAVDEEPTALSSTSPTPVLAVASLAHTLEEEWKVGRRYLQAGGTPNLTHAPGISSNFRHPSSAEDVSTPPPVSMCVCITSISLALRPIYWCDTGPFNGSEDPRAASLFDHLEQRLVFHLSGVKVAYRCLDSLSARRCVFTLHAESMRAQFAGIFNTPLLLSVGPIYERSTTRDTAPVVGEWLTATLDESFTCLTVDVGPSMWLLRPTHELQWWAAELGCFFQRLAFTESMPNGMYDGKRMPSVHTQKLSPSLSVKVALRTTDIVVPLTSRDLTFDDMQLTTRPSLLFSSSCHSYQYDSRVPTRSASPEETLLVEDDGKGAHAASGRMSSGNKTGVGCMDAPPLAALVHADDVPLDHLHLHGEACLVLCVPETRCGKFEAVDASCAGSHTEYYLDIGGLDQTIHAYCQYRESGACADRFPLPMHCMKEEWLSLPELNLRLSSNEVHINMESGVVVTLHPLICSLVSSELLIPCDAHTFSPEDQRAMADLLQTSLSAGQFISPGELHGADGVSMTFETDKGRHYATLFQQWLMSACESTAQRSLSRATSLVGEPLSADPSWGISLCLGLTIVRICDHTSQELAVIELASTGRDNDDQSTDPRPNRSPTNALKFSCFLPASTCSLDIPEVCVFTNGGQTLTTIEKIHMEMDPAHGSKCHIQSVSHSHRMEVLQMVKVMTDIFVSLTPRSRLLHSSCESEAPPSLGMEPLPCIVEVSVIYARLPLSSLPGPTPPALAITLHSVRMEVTSSPSASQVKLQGKVKQAMRIEEDMDGEEMQYGVLVNSLGVMGSVGGMRFMIAFISPSMKDAPSYCTFTAEGGACCVYMPFVYHLMNAMADPLYMELMQVGSSPVGSCGEVSCSTDGSKTTTFPFAPEQNAAVVTSQRLLVSGCINKVDVLLATDAMLPVDVGDDTSFFYTHVEEVQVCDEWLCDKVRNDEDAFMRLRRTITAQRVSYLPSSAAPPTQLVAHVNVHMDYGVLLMPHGELSSYRYERGQPLDSTIAITCPSVPKAQMDATGRNRAPSALHMVLSPQQLTALMESFFLNLLLPDPHVATVFDGATSPGANSCMPPASVVAINIPSVCVTLLDSNQHVFRIRLGEGLQFYKATGGQWSRSPLYSVQIRGLLVEGLTACRSRSDLYMHHGEQGHDQVAASAQSRRMLELARGKLTMVTMVDASVRPPIPSRVSITGSVDRATCYLAVEPWVLLHGIVMGEHLERCFQSSNVVGASTPIASDSVGEKITWSSPLQGTSSDATLLTPMECKLFLSGSVLAIVEACGDRLGTLCIPLLSLDILSTGECNRYQMVVRDPPVLLAELTVADDDGLSDWVREVPLVTWREAVSAQSSPCADITVITSRQGTVPPYETGKIYSNPLSMYVSSKTAAVIAPVSLHFYVGPWYRILHYLQKEADAFDRMKKPNGSTHAQADASSPVCQAPLVRLQLKGISITLPSTSACSMAQFPSDTLSSSSTVACIIFDTVTVNTSLECFSIGPADVDADMSCSVWCVQPCITVAAIRLLFDQLYPIEFPSCELHVRCPLVYSTFAVLQQHLVLRAEGEAVYVPQYSYIFPTQLPSGVVYERVVSLTSQAPGIVCISPEHMRRMIEVLRSLQLSLVTYWGGEADAVNAEVAPETMLQPQEDYPIVTRARVELVRVSVRLTARGANSLDSSEEVSLESQYPTKPLGAAFSFMAELRFLDRICITFVRPCSGCVDGSDGCVPSCRFAVVGSVELVDDTGATVMYCLDALPDGKEASAGSPPASTSSRPCISVDAEITDDSLNARAQVDGVVICLHSGSIDYALRMQHFLDRVIVAFYSDSTEGGPWPIPSCTKHPLPSKPLKQRSTVFTAVIHRFGLNVEKMALFEIRGIDIEIPQEALSSGVYAAVSASEVAPSADPLGKPKPYTFRANEAILRKCDGDLVWAVVHNVEVTLDVGLVKVHAQDCLINVYDTYFYLNVVRRVQALHLYISQRAKFSKKTEENFKLLVVVSLKHMRLRLCLTPPGTPPAFVRGYVEIALPMTVVKQTTTTTSWMFSVETEKGLIAYVKVQGSSVDSSLASSQDKYAFTRNLGISCYITEDNRASTRTVEVHVKDLECYVPLGETLQCSVEAFVKAAMPFFTPHSPSQGLPISADGSFAVVSTDRDAIAHSASLVAGGGAGQNSSPPPALPSFFIHNHTTLQIPLLTVNVCRNTSKVDDTHSDEYGSPLAHNSAEHPPVLLGILLHQITVDQMLTPASQITLAQVVRLTSVADGNLQPTFVSSTAPTGAVDASSKAAIYFRCEKVLEPASSTSSSLPTQRATFVGRAHAFHLTLSPALLSILNDEMLVRVARGAYDTRLALPCLKQLEKHYASSSSTSTGGTREGVLIINSSLCLDSDLVIGGRHGRRLRFEKNPLSSNPLNVLTLTGVNHARLLVSLIEDGGNQMQPPITIDSGLTVRLVGIPFVLEHGGSALDYVCCGERSIFQVASDLIVAPVGKTGCAQCTPRTTLDVDCAHVSALDHITTRSFHETVVVNFGADLSLGLWSTHQTMTITTKADAHYVLERTRAKESGDVEYFIDERGELSLHNVKFLCDSGPILSTPASVTVCVQHHKLSEDVTRSGLTTIHAVLPAVRLSVSVCHLRLLYETLKCLHTGTGYIEEVVGVNAYRTSRSHSPLNASSHSSAKSHRPLLCSQCARAQGRPSGSAPGEREIQPLVDVGLTAPSLELLVTNDFFTPVLVVRLESTAFHGKGYRGMSFFSGVASSTVEVADFPAQGLPRTLLTMCPELALDYSTYEGGGVSVKGTFACADIVATVPVLLLLRLVNYDFVSQRAGAFSFHNALGVPLVLITASRDGRRDETPLHCCVRPGETANAELFHWNQFTFRVVLGDSGAISSTSGTPVDLAALQDGAVHRFQLDGVSPGVLDAVLRLDAKRRVVHITSSVQLHNDFKAKSVSLGGDKHAPLMELPSRESAFVPLAILRQPLYMAVDGYCMPRLSSVLSLEMILQSFLLLPEGDDTIRGENPVIQLPNLGPHTLLTKEGTLIVPILLRRQDSLSPQVCVVHFVMRRSVVQETHSRVFTLLPKYEVDLYLRPVLTVVNATGTYLTVQILTDSSLIQSFSPQEVAEVSSSPGNTFVPLSHGDTFEWFPSCLEEVVHAPHLVCTMSCGDGDVYCFHRPVDLSSIESRMVVAVVAANGRRTALRLEWASVSCVVVRTMAVLHNGLPYAIRLYSVQHEELLGLGLRSELQPGERRPLLMPYGKRRMPQIDDAIHIVVTASTDAASPSQACLCGGPSSSQFLSTFDGSHARMFAAITSVTDQVDKDGRPHPPVVSFEPVWTIRNTHPSLSLSVRHVGLGEDEILLIPPQQSAGIVHCGDTSVTDPSVQFRYSEGGFFEWSRPIRLGTLCAAGVPLSFKHLIKTGAGEVASDAPPVPPQDGERAKLPVCFFNTCVPRYRGAKPAREDFSCLTVTSTTLGEKYMVLLNLDDNIPVVIENRTSHTVQFSQVVSSSSSSSVTPLSSSSRPWGYLVLPYTDCPYCWDVPTVDNLTIQLSILSQAATVQIIDLHAGSEEGRSLRLSDDTFGLITLDPTRRRFIISITEDRDLENALRLWPRYVGHVELFVQRATVYIASVCVSHEEKGLERSPLAVLVKQKQLRSLQSLPPHATESNILDALRNTELDVVAIRILGLYAMASLNERHIMAHLMLGSASVEDCTSPTPHYREVMKLEPSCPHPTDTSEDAGSGSQGPKSNSPAYTCFSVTLHMKRPSDNASLSPNGCQSTSVLNSAVGAYHDRSLISAPVASVVRPLIVALPIAYLRVDIGRLRLFLHDTFLYVLRSAVNGAIRFSETLPLPDGFGGGNFSGAQEPTIGARAVDPRAAPPNRVLSPPVIYDCYFNHIYVSGVDVELTLTRGVDGRFSPFDNLALGGTIIPSVERAPIWIRSVVLRDVHQRGSYLLAALAAVLYPRYRAQLWLQLYKVVGSLEALGNPLALVIGCGRGLRSLVEGTVVESRPLHAAREFFKETSSSMLHSVGLLSRLGSRTTAALLMDSAWLAEQESCAREVGARRGILWGLTSGMRGAVGGVFSRPLSGARTAGVTGFFTGMATGVLGLVSRPVASVLHGVGETAEFYVQLLRDAQLESAPMICYVDEGRNFVCPVSPTVLYTSTELERRQTEPLLVPQSSSGLNDCLVAGAWAPMDDSSVTSGISKYGTDKFCFISPSAYTLLEEEAAQAGFCRSESLSFIISRVGVHNVALHAAYDSFSKWATPNDFFNWVDVALAAELARELSDILARSAYSVGVRRQHPPHATLRNGTAEAVEGSQMVDLKESVDLSSLLKHVTVEQALQICTVREVKTLMSPSDFQRVCSGPLRVHCKRALGMLLLFEDAGAGENDKRLL